MPDPGRRGDVGEAVAAVVAKQPVGPVVRQVEVFVAVLRA
jgi:hypothetical protein